MTKEEYARYEAKVDSFFRREGVNNLSSGHLSCPRCGDSSERWWAIETGNTHCPSCGASKEAINEPYFSWHSCDCCGTKLGGSREHVTGYNPTTQEIYEYEVCQDCIYYAAYGQLDDMTMIDMTEE